MKAIRPLFKFGFFAIIFLVLGVLTYQIAVTQIENPGNFPETGHTISGEFLEFYQQVPNPELIYGYPITEQVIGKDGKMVQYFQRARFELHPEAPEGQQVQLTPLGRLMYIPQAPFTFTKNPAICQTFENNIDVCYSFLEFFNQHGGTDQFGLPISEVEERGGRLVQYFEKARLEWYPDSVEAGLIQEVQLTFLGRQYFDLMGEDPALLQRLQGSFVPGILSLQVHAFPVEAVVIEGEKQSIYVIVQDQTLSPVQDITIALLITYPMGETASITLPPTNQFGYTSADIPFSSSVNGVGVVTIEVATLSTSFEATTRTSFRIAP